MGKKINLRSNIVNDKFTEYLYDCYDIQNREETITEVPLPSDEDIDTIFNDKGFNIFLICGRSGSGKSTILRELSHKDVVKPSYDYDKCVISQFPRLSEEEACDLLSGVGLSSVPTWLRKPQELSDGERARLDICKALYDMGGDGVIYIDEFTSVVNRDAARSMSFALQRYVRANNLRVVIASCHFDVIRWLQPDYIFNLNHKDENGDVDVERIVYKNSHDYNSQQTIKDDDSLTEKMKIE